MFLKNKELINRVEVFLSKNRDSLSKEDTLLLEKCIEELHNLSKLRGEKNLELRNQVIIEVIQFLTRFFLSDF